MRVNLISNHRPGTGLSQDVNILRGILTAVFDTSVEIRLVQYVQPQCAEADINIFLEVVNPALLSYARKNIWIPNHEWLYKTWTPYLNMMDEIWVKTHETERILKDLTTTPIRFIGWTSLNKETPSRKNYYQAIVPLGKNMYREMDVLFQAYNRLRGTDVFSRLPILNIVYNPKVHPVVVPIELEGVVKLHQTLSDKDYDELLKECGLCICLSRAEGFGHAVNEAMASGCNLILSRIGPFLERIGEESTGALICGEASILENERCLGQLVSTDVQSLTEKLEEYVEMTFKKRKQGSELMRQLYESHHSQWMERMKELLPTLVPETPFQLKDVLPKEDELPDVSIVCVTRNRRLFMPILKYSYMIQSYPEEKMELIIVDDGEDSIEDTLFGVPNVTYIRLETPTSIGEKRNIGVSKAMYDVISFMDDDDVYPNNSILERVAMMGTKQCAFCSVIPCYDIVRYCSFMNAPPIQLPMSQRVSEATLVFTKSFWEERKFEDVNIAEADAFIRGREHMCRELSPQEVIVSLVHSKNTSSRKLPDFKEPNGCHFGFNEKLFAMVSEIGQSLHAEDGRVTTA